VRVFLSSTYVDLAEHRAAVVAALARIDQAVVRMEVFGARPEEPMQACLHEVERGELFIGIYAHRYGYVPPGAETSITESELRHAESLHKPILCFVVDDDHPWPPKFIDRSTAAEKIFELKRYVTARWVRDAFTTPADLASKVTPAVVRVAQEKAGSTTSTAPPRQHLGSVEGTALAQAVAMTFVDVMRLLYVHGSGIAKSANMLRYGRFLQILERHFDDLRSDLGRFGVFLPPALTALTIKIDRRLSALVDELRDESRASRKADELFQSAVALSGIVNDFIRSVGAEEHASASRLITKVVQDRAPDFDYRVQTMTRDEIYLLRYELQSTMLDLATSIQTIADDVDFVCAVPYFLIDQDLLRSMK
jgi:hypothetical protein